MSDLHLRSISHAFGDNAVLHGVSVSVGPGELVCLLGPSGCGKTTLLRIAAGLENLQSGQVEIAERMVADSRSGISLPPEKRGVGLMFQDFALFPHLNVHDNIGFGLSREGRSARDAWIGRALGIMGLSGQAKAFPHTLSGGQQQRVALLRALAPEPRVLLLDEPFSGLDVTRRAQIRAETLAIVKETGVATLMVTHDPEEAMFMADRILVMDEGRVVQDGPPETLYFHPINAFVTELFGQVNALEATVNNGKAETPLGTFDAPDGSDSKQVRVLIRPEAFILSTIDNATADGAAVVEVVSARPLGRSSVIFARTSCGKDIEARTSGILLPEAGSKLQIRVDPRLVHIFA